MNLKRKSMAAVISAIWLLAVVIRTGDAGQSSILSVPGGKRARIVSVRVPEGAGFRIVEVGKGWTVYRSWGDSTAVEGLVLGPGRYRVFSESEGTVPVEYELE